MIEKLLQDLPDPEDADSEFGKRLSGYSLATAEILYHMPDHPEFLQSFIWQELDLAPRFPILRRFLDFWHRNLDGPLHSVTVTSKALLSPAEFRFPGGTFRLH